MWWNYYEISTLREKLLNYYCIFWCVCVIVFTNTPFTLNASIRAYDVLFFIEDSIAIKTVLYPTSASQYDINHSKCNTLNHKNCRANFQRIIVTSHHTVPAAFSYILIATLSRAFNFKCTLFFGYVLFLFRLAFSTSQIKFTINHFNRWIKSNENLRVCEEMRKPLHSTPFYLENWIKFNELLKISFGYFFSISEIYSIL